MHPQAKSDVRMPFDFNLRRLGPSLLERQPKSCFKLKKSRVPFVIKRLCQGLFEYAIDIQQIS